MRLELFKMDTYDLGFEILSDPAGLDCYLERLVTVEHVPPRRIWCANEPSPHPQTPACVQHSKWDAFSLAYYGRIVLLLRISFSSPMPPRYAHPRLIAWLRRPIKRSQCSCYLCSQLGLRSLSITRGQPQITLERLRCLLGRYYFFLFG